MKTWALGAIVVSVLTVTACAKSPASTSGGGGSGGDSGVTTGGMTTTTGATSGTNSTGSNTTSTGSNTSSTSSGTTCMGGHDFMNATCNDCLGTNCCAEQTDCDTGTDCDSVFLCLAGCKKGDMACVMACAQNQAGATAHDALITCLQGSCMTECAPAQTPICDSGFAINKQNDVCATCLGDNCCMDFTACFKDQACHDCALNPMGAGCSMNALLTAANMCGSTKCMGKCM